MYPAGYREVPCTTQCRAPSRRMTTWEQKSVLEGASQALSGSREATDQT